MSELIDRQAALDALARTAREKFNLSDEYNHYLAGLMDGELAIKELPTIQPERKKGEWLPDNNNAYEMRFVCSCCKESEVVPTIGFTKYKTLWDFCPNCGADMRGEKDG
jgi:hypothetical protein